MQLKVNLSSRDLSCNQFMTMSTDQLLTNPIFTDKSTKFQSITGITTVVGLCALITTSMANAKDYMVEVLVFENINASAATESYAYTAPKKMKSGSKAWLIEPSMLTEEATIINQSPDYVLMHHYSWGVESLPYQESANYTVVEPDSQGYVKVYADQLLFTNIDLDYKGFRLTENRRLKLNEKHFFDHPKFGLVMQVSRLPAAPVEKQ